MWSERTTEGEKICKASARQTSLLFFFFHPTMSCCHCCARHKESSAVVARGRGSDCKLTRSSRCYFTGFSREEKRFNLNRPIDVVRNRAPSGPASQCVFNHFPCFCVLRRASTRRLRALGAIWKSIFRFAAKSHTNARLKRAHVRLICNLGFLLTTLSGEN